MQSMQPWSQVLVILLGHLACTGGGRTRQEFVLQSHHAEQNMELEQDLFAQQIFQYFIHSQYDDPFFQGLF